MAEKSLTMSFDKSDLARLDRALQGLSDIEKSAVVQKGFQEAAAMIKKKGKQKLEQTLSTDSWNKTMRDKMASKRGGSLVKSISTKTFKKKGKAHIGFKKTGHHAHLVDRGTALRHKKNGQSTGSVSKGAPNKGSLFWTKSFQENRQKAKDMIFDSIEQSIKRIWR